ncbi:cubilin-like [Babylonia areolata]|uniref:cubilin-like n=1 Tax=Babylonia areolata TaxID=304850 RepID=UPI003FD047EE
MTTLSFVFFAVVVAVQVTLCEGQFSICQYSRLDVRGSVPTLTLTPSPLTQSQDDIPVNSSVVSFHSSGNINSTAQCILEVSGNKIIQMNVTAFDLGGHDPCSPNEEHLTISFSRKNGQSSLTLFSFRYGFPKFRDKTNRGDMDTIMWCGRSYSTRLETRRMMVIRYFAGPESQRGSGFTLSFSSVDQFMCGRGVEQVGPHPMYIYSPGYPDVYDSGIGSSACSWKLISPDGRQLLLETDRFALESHPSCDFDFLKVNNEKYCGDQKLRITSQHDLFRITFSTDHNNQRDSFVLRVVEMADSASCGQEIVASTAPTSLPLSQLDPGQPNPVKCWWRVDAGSDDRVVFLENTHFSTSMSCTDLVLNIYDGRSAVGSPHILSRCAPLQMFRAVRSSSRYLYIVMDIQVNGVSADDIEGVYTVTSQLRDGVPRVLYAGFADSFIWLALSPWNRVGLYVRGSEEDVANYSTCLQLTVKESINQTTSLNVSDYLYVFSGHNSSFAELGTACGRTSSKVLISRGSKAYMVSRVLHNATRHLQGLWLMYSLQRNCEPAPTRLKSNSITQFVRSDQAQASQFPFNINSVDFSHSGYPFNAYCRWLIVPESSSTLIQASIVSMDLWGGNCNDNVTAYDDWSDSGSGFLWRWCEGDQGTSTFTSKRGGPLFLRFLTDSAYSDGGFRISYSSVYHANECPSMEVMVATEVKTILTSPNYPNNYPNGVDCRWLIRGKTGVVKLTLLNLSFSRDSSTCSRNDYLIIYDGKDSEARALATMCSSDTDVQDVTSSGPYVLVHFHSNLQGSASGFSLQYQTVPTAQLCNITVFVTEAEDRIIKSPYFPHAYPGHTDCFWAVLAPLTHVVTLEVYVLDLPCDSPVSLYDGLSEHSRKLASLCYGRYKKRYVSSQKYMYIRFRSTRNRFSSSGFKFRLRSWKSDNACSGGGGGGGYHVASTIKRYISSPGYPGSYPPNTACKWRIESAVKNMTVRIDFEDTYGAADSYSCQRNTVNVYDGYGSGSKLLAEHVSGQSETYWSSELYLFLSFESNSAAHCKGFRLSYQAVSYRPSGTPAPENKDSVSGTTTMVISIVGGMVFTVVVLSVCCVYWRKRRSAQNTSASQSHRTPSTHHRQEREGSTVYMMNPVIVNQMAPPAYPGMSNGSHPNDDLPPAYPAVSDPPLHWDGPPSYAESMLETNPPSGTSVDESRGHNQSGVQAAQNASDRLASGPDHRTRNSAPPRDALEYSLSASHQGEESPQHRPPRGLTLHRQQSPPPYQTPSPPTSKEQEEPSHDSPPPPRRQHRRSDNSSPSPRQPAPERLPMGALPSTQRVSPHQPPPGGQRDDEGSAGDTPSVPLMWIGPQGHMSTEV